MVCNLFYVNIHIGSYIVRPHNPKLKSAHTIISLAVGQKSNTSKQSTQNERKRSSRNSHMT